MREVTATHSPLRVSVPAADASSYDVVLERGALRLLGRLCRDAVAAHRYAVIADSRVGELYGARAIAALEEAGLSAELHTFPAGEWNKTRREWSRLTDRLLEGTYGRDSAVVALGGGVANDLAGFVAATYLRGVPVVQVPTTLLGMFDSAIGGKTGVDTRAGKNLVGAFHHPRLVLIDPELIDTLPRIQRIAGLAEAIKTAAVLDVDLLDWLEQHAERLVDGEAGAVESAVDRVTRHKAAVVSADPVESARRAILNFGHTVGHALELLGGYEILHGEAVAAGMRVEARLGEDQGVTEVGTAERLTRVLEACQLDGRPELDRDARDLWEALSRDKKARGGTIRCVLLRRIGDVARDPDGAYSFELPNASGREWLEAALRA